MRGLPAESNADPQPELDEAVAAQAEEVRAYLVALRGGAPFLSSADGRLLVSWLDAGVPVPLILTTLDRVADKRSKKRYRTRMTLNAARKAVDAAWGTPQTAPAAAVGPARRAVVGWLDAVAADGGDAVAGLVTAGRDRLSEGGDIDAILADLAAACGRLHDHLWRSDPARQEALLAEARADLAPLSDKVSAAVLSDLVEEAARARLRRQWPLVCAAELWDRVAESRAVTEP